MRRLTRPGLVLVPVIVAALAIGLLLRGADEVDPADSVREQGEGAHASTEASLRGSAVQSRRSDEERASSSTVVGQVRRGMSGVPAVVELRRLHDLLTRHRPRPGPFGEGYLPSREDLLAQVGHSRRVASALTDLEGRFTLPIPGPGVYDVRALATDGAARERPRRDHGSRS